MYHDISVTASKEKKRLEMSVTYKLVCHVGDVTTVTGVFGFL